MIDMAIGSPFVEVCCNQYSTGFGRFCISLQSHIYCKPTRGIIRTYKNSRTKMRPAVFVCPAAFMPYLCAPADTQKTPPRTACHSVPPHGRHALRYNT